MLNPGKGSHYPIERDHSGICKFACKHDDDYKAVYIQITRMVKRAKITVAARIVFKGCMPSRIRKYPIVDDSWVSFAYATDQLDV